MSQDLTAPDAISMSQNPDPMTVSRGFDTGLQAMADNPGQVVDGNDQDLGIYNDEPAQAAPADQPPPAPVDEARRWQNQYRDAQIQLRRTQAAAERQVREARAQAQLPPEMQQLQQLMQYPGAKAKLTEFLGALAQDPNFDPGQRADAVQDRGLRQEFEQMKPLLNEFQELTEALRYERAETQVNAIHDDLKQTYPDAFAASPDLFQEIARTTLERYGDDPTPDHIRAVSYELILKSLPKATQRAAGQLARAMSQQPAGSRIVSGTGASASAPPVPPKNYARMSWRDLEQSGTDGIDIFAAT